MKLFTKTRVIIAALMVAFLGVAASALGVSSPIPPGGVPIDSDTAVMNVTSGDNRYHNTVTAAVDEVVKVETWYHNTEDDDSGKIARDVNVRINIPTKTSTSHTVTGTVGGTNTNIISEIAVVNTPSNAALQYIPGTAYRRYNAGTNANPNIVTVRIPDSVVSGGYTVGDVQPCWNFQETITVQARVIRPTLSITKQVRVTGTETWQYSNTADPGDSLDYKIIFKNEGNTTLNNVIIRDNLPPLISYINGTTKVYTPSKPNGYNVPDGVTGAGVNVGNYAPGSFAILRFSATLPQSVGSNTDAVFRNIAVVRADGLGEYYNEAVTTVRYRSAAVTQLRIVKFNDANANRIQDSGEARLSGWSFRVSGPNGYVTTLTTGSDGIYTLTNISPGRYVVTEILRDGWENTTGLSIERDVNTDPATQTFRYGNRAINRPPVTPPNTTPPGGGERLPSTGPVETAGMAFGSLSLSGVAMAWARSKKKLKEAFRK